MALLDVPLALTILCGCSLIGAFVLWYGSRDLRVADRILTNDPTDVMSLGDGSPVEVEGVAHAEDGTITSPFTGTECLAYE